MFKKISMDELKKGMKICALERDDTGRPSFFMNALLIQNEDDIEAFRGKGFGIAYVMDTGPDEEGGIPGEFAKVQDIIFESPSRTQGLVSFSEEVRQAMDLKDEAVHHVMDLLTDIKVGRSVDTSKVGGIIVQMVDSVFRNTDALTSLVWLRSYDTCTFIHSINVCILSVALGKELGISRGDLCDLGMSAVLHDIGKLLLPEGLLNKPGRFTEQESHEMQRHPELGADLLSRTGGIKDVSVSAAYQHHEKINGTGYPKKLAGPQIHQFGRIICIADSYDAMTSKRVYRTGNFTPHEALQLMYFKKNVNYDEKMIEQFIRCLGIYPIGSMVELNTGEICLVKSANPNDLLRPHLITVLDDRKRMVNSRTEMLIGGQSGRRIIGTVNPDKFNMDVFKIMC